ncbi:MAG: diacylglycerol kinase family protein [Cyclobacteriaceae bacterium]
MDENKKVLFIINKYSGTKYQPGVEGRILTQCADLGLECTIEFTLGRGHATELARQAAQANKYEVVFAVGGDGTVNEVAKGVLHTKQIMGIIPRGSGNGLARHLGIPINFTKALQYIGSTSTVHMDSFMLNDHLSVNVSGIGFDGHIAGRFGQNGKRGLMGYTKLVMKDFLSYPEFNSELQIDSHRFKQDAFVIAIANSSQFGNNARIAPQASVCDGLLDISLIRKPPIAKVAGFITKMFSGRLHQSDFAEIKKGKKVVISFPEPMPYHIDGEGLNPISEFRIEILPASIRMLVPTTSLDKV